MITHKLTSTLSVASVLLLLLVGLSGCNSGDGHDGKGKGTPADTTAPTVSFTFPLANATDVAINSKVYALFSEPLNQATITSTSFTLTGPGTTPVGGLVTYNATSGVADFAPTLDLTGSVVYTATITTAATDIAGNPLTVDYMWFFTAGGSSDTTAPTVTLTIPADLEINVPLNRSITAVFDESMDTLTLTNSTFTLMQGATPVAGSVACPGTTATFNPTLDLAPTTVYTATITTGAEDAAGNPLAANFVWTFTTGLAPDITRPTVTLTVPDNGATNVRLAKDVSAVFSETMDPATLTTATFTLANGVTPVVGTVSCVGSTAAFNPTANLTPDTVYTATITTGAEDLAGNALLVNYVWSFRTTADITRPTVKSTLPTNAAVNAPINTRVFARFSEAMDSSTLTATSFLLTGPGVTPVAGTVGYDATNFVARFIPSFPLTVAIVYTATITTQATDAVGNALLVNYVWTFTTVAADAIAPTVTSTIPLNTAINVPLNARVTAIFSEAMDTFTLNTMTFTLADGIAVVGSVVCPFPSTSATFIPNANLAPSTLYTATITIAAADLAGNTLAVAYVWSFTTGTAAMVKQSPLNLQSADGFAVLAGTTITNTGPTIIDGNVGLDPGSAITGFPPGTIINGSFMGPGLVVAQAKVDLTAAYNDAAGRSVDSISCPGNLGGLTLAPGLYTNSSTVQINGTGSSAILTLDAQGDENAVWIFQIASTLTTTVGTSIVLSGGAQAKNIYWQVGSSATLGVTSVFKGNILALVSITMTTSGTLDGRALARNGAVDLQSNSINKPAP